MKNDPQKHDIELINWITGQVLDAAIEVHRELGAGFLEAVYEDCLAMRITG